MQNTRSLAHMTGLIEIWFAEMMILMHARGISALRKNLTTLMLENARVGTESQ
jgi:hypothetical protein